jgi:hypothetical protein
MIIEFCYIDWYLFKLFTFNDLPVLWKDHDNDDDDDDVDVILICYW